MSSKNAVLARIREALRIAAPLPVVHDHNHGPHSHGAPQAESSVDNTDPNARRAWLPRVPEDAAGRMALFERNCAELKTELLRLKRADLPSALANLAEQNRWSRIATHSGADTGVARQLQLAEKPLVTDSGYSATELERCDAGITACDCLVAQTGTIVLTAKSAGGRALSVLPPHHVVIASEAQIVPDLLAAFELLQSRHGPDYPSFMTLITGPSRTGDIERILVLGAHGPKRLTLLCTAD
jgi:L-lactate dehydrogenase complex protein LldG